MKIRSHRIITCGLALVAVTSMLAVLPGLRSNVRESTVVFTPAIAAEEEIKAEARSVDIDGAIVGEVLVNGKPVLRIRTYAGGLTPVERADVVARRLNELATKLGTAKIHSGVVRSQAAVMADDELIVTADNAHAAMNGTTPSALAETWSANLASALGRPVAVAGEAATVAAVDTADEDQDKKVVPILSIGSGLRVGAALVVGPSSQVEKVKVVAQLEANFKGARIRGLVPIETESLKELHRVPETSVAGIADIKL